MRDVIDQLKEIVGENHVITDEKDKLAYETPWRGEKGNAAFVVRPKTTEDVSRVVALLVKKDIPFIPQSGNTGLVYASVPDQSGTQAVLNLSRLTQVFDINPVNRSAHVGAGVLLSALNNAAEKAKLFFPIDLGSDPCLGGMVATNTGGSRLLRYGGVRENLLGLKVVMRDEEGTILDLNSELRKNNTGLDLKQLFVGTGGKYGIITECVLALSPIPQQSATALMIPASLEALPKLLSAVEEQFGHELSAFEGMSKNAVEAAFAHNNSLKNGFNGSVPDYTCLIELSRSWTPREGEKSLDEALQDGLGSLMEHDDTLIADALFGHAQDHWDLRHSLSEGVQKSGKLVGFDLGFARDKAMAFRSYMLENLPAHFPDIEICDFGHVGDGAMHLSLVIDHDDERLQDAEFIPSLQEYVFDRAVLDFGGSYSAEHGLGPLNKAAYEKYTPDSLKKIASKLLKCNQQ